MKATKYITLLFAIFLQYELYGQTKSDLQVKSEAFTHKLISLLEQKNYPKLKQITTEKLYCYLCFKEAPNGKPVVNKNTFYTKYADKIFNNDLLSRLKRNETKFLIDNPRSGECIVLYTTYRPNELTDGHEGAQFGFWLKDEKGKLKFSGVEMIP